MTYYDILGVPYDATYEQIKKAYREQIKFFHPDVFNGSEDVARIKTLQLNEAYEVLRDRERRRTYDEYLKVNELYNKYRNQNKKNEGADRTKNKRSNDGVNQTENYNAEQASEHEPQSEQREEADEISSLKKKLSELENRYRIVLEYSRKTCREIANVPKNAEFNENHWPVNINGITYMVRVDQNGKMYHKENCPYCNMGRVTNVFNLPRNCSPCRRCQPIQVYGLPQWLKDYWNAIAVKEKYGILDPDIPVSQGK